MLCKNTSYIASMALRHKLVRSVSSYRVEDVSSWSPLMAPKRDPRCTHLSAPSAVAGGRTKNGVQPPRRGYKINNTTWIGTAEFHGLAAVARAQAPRRG